MKKLSALAVLVIVAALAVAACGGGDSSTSGGTETAAPAESEASGGGSETTESETAEGGGGGSEAGSTITFEANPEGQLMFTTMKTTGKAGDDTIEFKNPSSVPHNVAIEDESGKTIAESETIAKGETSTEAELEPGTYTYYCSVPGHREAGMEGTLTIE